MRPEPFPAKLDVRFTVAGWAEYLKVTRMVVSRTSITVSILMVRHKDLWHSAVTALFALVSAQHQKMFARRSYAGEARQCQRTVKFKLARQSAEFTARGRVSQTRRCNIEFLGTLGAETCLSDFSCCGRAGNGTVGAALLSQKCTCAPLADLWFSFSLKLRQAQMMAVGVFRALVLDARSTSAETKRTVQHG
jgi:hypothetical protein